MKTNKILQVIILVYLYFMYGRNELAVTLLKNKKSVKCLEYYDALFNPPGILEYPYFFKLNVSYAFYLV